jgi:hypothetical protein
MPTTLKKVDTDNSQLISLEQKYELFAGFNKSSRELFITQTGVKFLNYLKWIKL